MFVSINMRGRIVRRRRQGGFTMVEIALSLAVVAFALVAIIGVLPTGMTVEKDNREDTLINQEGRYWLEAIKTGAHGLHDLTNYVEEISLYKEYFGTETLVMTVTNTEAKPVTSADIIGLLTTPKYGFLATTNGIFFASAENAGVTNKVVARVKAITGSAAEKGTNDLAFRYQIEVEVVPDLPMPPAFAAGGTPLTARFNNEVGYNLHNIRLIVRWPVLERGNGWFVGNGRKSFRAKIVGKPLRVDNPMLGTTNWFITPNQFVNVGT